MCCIDTSVEVHRTMLEPINQLDCFDPRENIKKACLIFSDENDAVGSARFDDGASGDNEMQRTMLEHINQLDGFDSGVLLRYGPLSSRFYELMDSGNLVFALGQTRR